MEGAQQPDEKMLDIDEGPKPSESKPSQAYLDKKTQQKNDEMKRVDEQMEQKQL